MESKRRLSDDEESELKSLWRKLVKLFHPDRFADDPEKMATYTKLTGAINAAKDSGDLETLRQIADIPDSRCRSQFLAKLRDEAQRSARMAPQRPMRSPAQHSAFSFRA